MSKIKERLIKLKAKLVTYYPLDKILDKDIDEIIEEADKEEQS